jgi:hypothetical protein
VMEQLMQRGVSVKLISLCEFRRMETPERELKALAIPFVRLVSLKFKGATTSTGKKNIGGNKAFVRNVLRSLVWFSKVKGSLTRVNQIPPDLVVVPNDIAFPFDRICRWLKRREIPFILQQEGVRFPLPNEEGWSAYGTNGAQEILAWGEDSVQYFRSLPVAARVLAAGNPRFDNMYLKRTTAQPDPELMSVLGRYNILYVSNPVDDQGFCTHEEKLELFRSFLKGVKPLREQGITVFVRLHPREALASFKSVVEEGFRDMVVWAQEFSLFDLLARMDITIVLASTVGLESMMLGAPVAVIKLPRHGYVFNYVSSGSAVGIDVSSDFSEVLWKALTIDKAMLKKKCVTYMDNQLSNRGQSASFISNHLFELMHANQ